MDVGVSQKFKSTYEVSDAIEGTLRVYRTQPVPLPMSMIRFHFFRLANCSADGILSQLVRQECVMALVSRNPTEAATTETHSTNSIKPAHLPSADVRSVSLHT